ncbi:acetyl-CoA C-acyltransferase [Pseudobacteriovorax antillogorgiicola]|uniref:3-ketoacyl-CoA thiolase n=1 Tax=Pseudobacteriovorax antillogorgiicola TaxID=1513793 RepID=A0A1Y6B8A4_9BACT|nr:acetyl-CoA C-acyltransferase [Pseudobacteriovorax antillogorgiicola]TCS59204.1 3-ketoacyl-CoA thiolase [Pseudobacteriovorax antillogorgiicola]SME90594.1 3-ketoacyl-CoA thiolase [Pseudobacteriovorax antillogorgiicola]
MEVKKYRGAFPEGNGNPVFIDGVRTPFVKSFGAFQKADTLELFSRVVEGLLRKTGIDPEQIDEVSAGVVIPQTKNANVARDAIINLGLPDHIHGYTLNRACTSSMHSIADAAKEIKFGHPAMILAGGVECLSDVPIAYSKKAQQFLLELNKAKTGADRLAIAKKFSAKDWLPKPPALAEPLTGLTMGESAEIMAKINEISREDQDKFAAASHLKAAAAQKDGRFDEEVIPVWASPSFDCVEADNIIRADTSAEKMAKLKPVFDKKYGSLTAANSSPLTDGASVSLIMDEKRAQDLGLSPKSKILDFTFVGIDPTEQLLIGPAIAIPLLLKRNNMTFDDIDLFEIHEAFAAQVLSCTKSMDSADFCERYFGDSKAFGAVPEDKLNVNGGAIAIGHPFGATGSRLVTTLSNELIRRDKNIGLIGICAAGGMAGAMLIERTK